MSNTATEHVRIAIVDHHELFREGVKRILELEPDFQVVGEGRNGSEALNVVNAHHPHILIMDVNMPDSDGLETVKRLVTAYPQVKIIALTGEAEEAHVLNVVECGASGFLLKEVAAFELVLAVRSVHAEGVYLHPRAATAVVRHYRRLLQTDNGAVSRQKTTIQADPLYKLLSRRELEVLHLLAEGFSNREISDTLFISEKTVKNHVSAVLRKMKVNDRTQAVVEAVRRGWVQI